ncbi:hypothetical protein HIM_01466 [Hirsutella minnesotensis 3608]|nr:hypothetical protein HIM_01466 [Hirsutella minnesotensis 3608]
MRYSRHVKGAATVLLSTLVVGIIGLQPAIDAPLEGYDVFTPEWEVEMSPKGRTIRLNGTIEEVYQELLQLNPKYEQEFVSDQEPQQEPSSSPQTPPNSTSSIQGIDWNVGSTVCGGKWAPASAQRIREGIRHLRRVRGRPGSQAGPARCGRVSCSYNSAIWWCNDRQQYNGRQRSADQIMACKQDNKYKGLSSFADIADGAQLLVTRCAEWMNPEPKDFGGQAFHPSRWNVIVRSDRC